MRCILLNIFGIHFLSIFWRSWKYFIHQTDLNYNHIIDSSKLIESITEITSSFLNFKFLVSLNQSSKKFLKETIILLKHYHKRSYLLLWSLSSNLPSHTTIDFLKIHIIPHHESQIVLIANECMRGMPMFPVHWSFNHGYGW